MLPLEDLMFNKIKIRDNSALQLIAPKIVEWKLIHVIAHPQAMHYIDLDSLNGIDWARILKYCPQFEDLCTEYGGWAKMINREWDWILKYHPEFEKYKK